MDPCRIPFEVGQLVEMKSFLSGYRGAWFRCKIMEFGVKNKVHMEYIDYPDDGIKKETLYEKEIGRNDRKNGNLTLMLRPRFPRVYRESEMPNMNNISEVVVIVNDVWKVGDLVDWFTTGCFWCGKITEILGDEKVKIELLPPPAGEGSSYEVLCKELRPSLDWSVDKGWCIPKGSKDHIFSARIVKPDNQGNSPNLINHTVSLGEKNVQAIGAASISQKGSDKAEHPKKIKIDQSIPLNSTSSDTTETAILDLEELICRVNWLKQILEFGMPLSETGEASWKFVEHGAPSNKPK
ncbi:hypothetical protein CCACVL1_03670 [Corchorus capsularis]|uniref:Agenet domain-containing protein n=1 Tax=Corchorus capsularis TaxID=210143 RepID=A0A1R3JXW6_COCAP|nr:hypothetical protein CCACVL1_03670 [Corchorus capsularis]